MPNDNYAYTDRRRGPRIHQFITVKLVQGHSMEDVAHMACVSVEVVRKVADHTPNAEFLRQAALMLQADEEILAIQHNGLVHDAIDTSRAVARAAISYDEDGEPQLNMQTKKDGTQIPVVPASLLKTIMIEPLDHDPLGRFTKKLDIKTTSKDRGFGGSILGDFKKQAIMEGFTPPQIIDAEFDVVRDGGGVLEATSARDVEIEPES